MKKLPANFLSPKNLLLLCCLSITTILQAQLDIDVDFNRQEWYEDPKVWVGVAVFLLLLAFIVRSKK